MFGESPPRGEAGNVEEKGGVKGGMVAPFSEHTALDMLGERPGSGQGKTRLPGNHQQEENNAVTDILSGRVVRQRGCASGAGAGNV